MYTYVLISGTRVPRPVFFAPVVKAVVVCHVCGCYDAEPNSTYHKLVLFYFIPGFAVFVRPLAEAVTVLEMR